MNWRKTKCSWKHSTFFFGFIACICALGIAGSPAKAQQDYRLIAVTLVQQYVSDEQVQQLKGDTVAVLPFEVITDDENSEALTLHEWITTELVKAKLLKVVDRKQLDKVLEEMKLQKSGLVAPETQQQLGKLLGAKYLLLGTLTKQNRTLSVTTRLLRVEDATFIAAAAYPFREITQDDLLRDNDVRADNEQNPQVKISLISWDCNEFQVSTNAESEKTAMRGVLTWLVEQKILGSAADVLERWLPEITQSIYQTPDKYISEVIARPDAYYIRINFTRVIRELNFIIFGKITPRISVDTVETIIRRQVPDPAVQTELESALVRYGFQVVDSTHANHALFRESLRQLETGDARAMSLVQNAMGELGADISAVGESFAEERQNRDGFDARVEFKMVDRSSARIFTSIGETYALTSKGKPNLDPTSGVFAKLSLQECAQRVVVRMASEILCSYGQPVYRIRVWKIDSFDNRTLIINHLKAKLPGATVTARQMDLRGSNSAIIEVMTKKSADTIGEILQGVPGQRVTVTDIECRSIVCELK